MRAGGPARAGDPAPAGGGREARQPGARTKAAGPSLRPLTLHGQRRRIQLVFLLLFFVLLTFTVWPLGRVFLGAFLLADPLVALNSLVNGGFRWEMLLALALLVLPLVLGRAFCGYVCPLGAVIELTGPRLASRRWRRAKLPAGDPAGAIRATATTTGDPSAAAPTAAEGRARGLLLRAPVFVLVACLGLLLFGTAAYLVFDPLVLLTRTSTILAYPLLDRALRLLGDLFYLLPPARPAVDAVTGALSGRLVFSRPLGFELQLVVLLMAAAVLGLSYVERRLWCRHLCPLGALLGQLARLSRFGRVVDQDHCTGCGRCEQMCPLGAVRNGGRATDPTRCELGLECLEACPSGAVSFGRRQQKVAYDPSRRALLRAGALALGAGFFTYSARAQAVRNALLVRPPGSQPERTLLSLCSRCGQCLKVCPTNVLQPSLRSGVEGLFTPEMSFVHGSCDWNCNECGKVCPTGAIQPLTLEEKRRAVIGRAYIDHNRCYVWADFTNCGVCEELCPTPQKAVVFQDETVRTPSGETVPLKRPWIVADRCIGCGVCQANCPVAYEAAVQVRATAGTAAP